MPPKGRYVSQPAISDKAERFALAIAAGLGPTEAARIVGYAQPSVTGAALGRDPRVRAVIQTMRGRRLDKLASLAVYELEAMLRDRSLPAGARFNAVRLSLALGGHHERPADQDDGGLSRKDVAEMTLEELDAFIAAERGRRAGAARPVLDHEPRQPAANALQDNEKARPSQGSALPAEALGEGEGQGGGPAEGEGREDGGGAGGP